MTKFKNFSFRINSASNPLLFKGEIQTQSVRQKIFLKIVNSLEYKIIVIIII